jgi:hypothetical protein
MKLTLLICTCLATTTIYCQQAHRIHGNVKDPIGWAVPGALVELEAKDHRFKKVTVRADNAGAFDLTLPDDKYRLCVSWSGFDKKCQNITNKTDQRLEIVLKPAKKNMTTVE